MKRYLLFAGDTYYPEGGWNDFIAEFDSWDDAIKRADMTKCNWWHIVDTMTKSIVLYK